MKTRTGFIAAIAAGAAIVLILSASSVYGMAGRTPLQLATYPSGMMGGFGYVQTGAAPSYSGGMMGGYGGMMGGYGRAGGIYGGMMGTGSMMGGYGGMMGQYAQTHNNRVWNESSNVPFVAIFNGGFYPASLTVSKGTSVTWVNMDFVQHTVTSGSEQAPTSLFDSHELNHMQGFSYTFSAPGTYAYFCDIHPYMVGTITVTG